ncbi:YlbF/YmcA family competence regulator [Streptococcus dentasini]
MTANIYDLANELERGIRALPEYQTLVDQKAQIDANEEAKTLFTEFSAFQEQIYTAMQSGQMPSESDQKKIEELGQKLEDNSLLKSYLEAQQALSVYLNDIEKIVFSPLRDLN